MEQIDFADVSSDDISVERCRELLGDESVGLSDEDVEQIKRCAETVASAVLDAFMRDGSRVH